MTNPTPTLDAYITRNMARHRLAYDQFERATGISQAAFDAATLPVQVMPLVSRLATWLSGSPYDLLVAGGADFGLAIMPQAVVFLRSIETLPAEQRAESLTYMPAEQRVAVVVAGRAALALVLHRARTHAAPPTYNPPPAYAEPTTTSTPPKQGGFKNKVVRPLLILFLVIGGVVAFLGGGDKKPTPALVGLNTTVRVGDVSWSAQALVDEGNMIGSENALIDDLRTSGKFVRVRFVIENLSQRPLSFSGAELRDGQGRTFRPRTDFGAFAAIPENERCASKDMVPGIPRSCQLIYELPVDARDLELVADGLSTFGGTIRISLGK